METMLRQWLHQTTTILGLAVLGGATTSVLLDTATPKQALAAAISGIIAIILKEHSVGTAILHTPGAEVSADTVAVQISPGGTANIGAPKA